MEHAKFHLTPILTPTLGQDWCCFMDILELLFEIHLATKVCL